VNTSIVCLAVLFSTPSVNERDQTVYRPVKPFETVIRGQSPGYDENPMTGGSGTATSQSPQTFVAPNVVPDGTIIYPNQNMVQDPTADPFMQNRQGLLPGSVFAGVRSGINGPQPYQLNRLISRYDFGILPNSSADQGLGDFNIFEFDAEWEFAEQIAPSWILSKSLQFNMRSWDGPTGSPLIPTTSLPGSVFRFGANFELATPANHPWGVLLAFNPSLNSDFRKTLSSNAWNWDGHGMIFYRPIPQWTWVAGAGFWDRVNDRVIPYAGFIWTPTERWEWRAVLPNPRISYFIGKISGLDTWFYARGEYHVEAYEIQLETTGRREKVELRDWRVLMGFRFDNGWYSSFVEAGWVFGRDVTYLNGTPGFDVTTGFIGRAGFRF